MSNIYFTNTIKTILQTYWGDSLIQLYFYISLLIIFIKEKKSWKKQTYFWYPLLVIIALTNPLTIILGNYIWGENIAYYTRQFSLVPIFYVIAYACVIAIKNTSKAKKFVIVFNICALLVLSGNSTYKGVGVFRASNFMKIPDGIVDVCDTLHSDTKHITLMFPTEWQCYVRQYDASFHTISGRGDTGQFSMEVSSNNPNVEYIMKTSCISGIDYVVVHDTETIRLLFAEKGYEPYYISPTGFLVYSVSGYDTIKYEYNEREQVVAMVSYDANGNRSCFSQGYSKIVYNYGKNGLKNGCFYFDSEDNPYYLASGEAGRLEERTKTGKIIKLTYVDEDGQPIFIENGISSIIYEYDDYGYESKETYYDTNGNVTENIHLYASISFVHDSNGLILEDYYYDRSGKPILNDNGYAGRIRTYDALNRVESIQYLGINKEYMILESTGYSKIVYSYSDDSQVLVEKYYDSFGHPLAMDGIYNGIKKTYDSNNRVIEQTFLNEMNQAVLISQGYSTVKYTRDSDGNILEEKYYDTYGNSVANTQGVHCVKRTYNSLSELLGIEYYDLNGNLINL